MDTNGIITASVNAGGGFLLSVGTNTRNTGTVIFNSASQGISCGMGTNGSVTWSAAISTFGTPVAVSTANAEGTSPAAARADHVHFSPSRAVYEMTDVLTPNNADWAINAFAPLASDVVNASLSVRYFDAAAQEGVGFGITIPNGVTSITFYFKSRARSAAGSTLAVIPALYTRTFSDNGSPGAWSAATSMTALSIPNNTNVQYDSQTITLSTLGLTAGNYVLFELTRLATNAGDTLTVDWGLIEVVLEFV
jgi:hypothetical protein